MIVYEFPSNHISHHAPKPLRENSMDPDVNGCNISKTEYPQLLYIDSVECPQLLHDVPLECIVD